MKFEGDGNLGKMENIDDSLKIPERIFAEVIMRNEAGNSILEASESITSSNIKNFRSERHFTESVAERLRRKGFTVLFVSSTSINIESSRELYEHVFKTKIKAEERETIKKLGKVDKATYLDSPETEVFGLIDPSKSDLDDVIAGVAIDEPVYFFGNPLPPKKAYWHLNVPSDISKKLNADRAHSAGFTGKGIKLVMIDTGWYRHQFFIKHGYSGKVVLSPATDAPEHDEYGHGTGESANAFSVAPDIDFTMVKMSFVNSIGAFNMAVSLKPDIISCSWGSSKKKPSGISAPDKALAAAIANAVDLGITVVYSAGNGQYGFPGQHPDVISAGGVYVAPDDSLEATPYASGFESEIYPGRKVPDVCGLVGLPPKGQYIMLPVEDNDTLDRELAGGTHPDGDETAVDDGWAVFSGTSAAAPQLAGICALMKQVNPSLSPSTYRDILMKTATDVTKGCCNKVTGGHLAKPGQDLATGCGLANAFEAVLSAQNQTKMKA